MIDWATLGRHPRVGEFVEMRDGDEGPPAVVEFTAVEPIFMALDDDVKIAFKNPKSGEKGIGLLRFMIREDGVKALCDTTLRWIKSCEVEDV